MLAEVEIKTNFHQLIDDIQDTDYLKELYQSIASLVKKKDVLDDLPPHEILRLEQALEQEKRGEFIPHNIVKQKHQKWLMK